MKTEHQALEQKMEQTVNEMHEAKRLKGAGIIDTVVKMPNVWKIDWSKVDTFEDLKTVLSEMNVTFTGPIENFPNAAQYLTKVR